MLDLTCLLMCRLGKVTFGVLFSSMLLLNEMSLVTDYLEFILVTAIIGDSS